MSLLHSTKTKAELADALSQVAEQFGFLSFALTSHERGPNGAAARLVLDGLPAAFQQNYVTRDYGRVSPVTQRAEASDEPFWWHELSCDDPEAQKVMAEAAEAGLEDGYSVPVHLPHGGRGSVSFGGKLTELSPEQRISIHALALAAQAQLRHLSEPVPEASTGPKLSAREREVLRWTAAGKTAEETGRILAISVRTVEYHLLNASRKMNTVNRTHTVVEALRSKQLSL